MKKKNFVAIVTLAIVVASIVSSCGSSQKGCKSMRHHNSDRKRGLAS